MIVTLVIFLLTIPINILAFALGIFAHIIPSWLNYSITLVLGNSGFVGSILPMQAHPGMWGMAGVTGIMPIIGFIFLLGGYVVTVEIVIVVAKLFIALLPWNTSGASLGKMDKK